METQSMKMNTPPVAVRGDDDVTVPEGTSCLKNAVLLIDDEARLRALFSNALKSEGIAPHFSENAFKTFETWSQKHPDVLFVELKIPGAWTFACHIKSVNPLVRVILLLNRDPNGIRKTLGKAGIDSILVKPVTSAAIHDAVSGAFSASFTFPGRSEAESGRESSRPF